MDDRRSRAGVRALHRALQHVPAGAAVYYIGVMLSRQPPTVRVCLAGLHGERLYDYVRRIGWPGSEARLREALGAITAVSTRGSRVAPATLVHVDIADTIQPVMGIEYVFNRRRQLHGTISEQPLLDRLVTAGLCTPAKRDALHAWSGWSIDHWAGECWPSVVVRRVNHLKLVHGSQGEMTAKIYLSVHHRFLQGLSGVRAA